MLSQLTPQATSSETASTPTSTQQPDAIEAGSSRAAGGTEEETRTSRDETARLPVPAQTSEAGPTQSNGLVPPSPSSPGRNRSRSRSRTRSSSSPSRPQPLFFPPRAIYVRQQAQKQQASSVAANKSSLSALFAPSPASEAGEAGVGGTKSNPFARLYSSIISRTALPAAAPKPPPSRRRYGPPPAAAVPSDVLLLTIFFPFSSTPSKGLKLPLKRHLSAPVTVEETIGAGLYSYWEEGRTPSLDEGDDELVKRAQKGLETTRWELRVVEDEEGTVDEDFPGTSALSSPVLSSRLISSPLLPALDRTRAIAAFNFTELAIVEVSEQQGALFLFPLLFFSFANLPSLPVSDNLAKQVTLVRRPSRILAVPIGPPPPLATAQPASTSSTAPAAQQQKQEATLRVLVPENLIVSEEGGKDGMVEVKVDPQALLHDVLRSSLPFLSPRLLF
jgi:hypothetical protein